MGSVFSRQACNICCTAQHLDGLVSVCRHSRVQRSLESPPRSSPEMRVCVSSGGVMFSHTPPHITYPPCSLKLCLLLAAVLKRLFVPLKRFRLFQHRPSPPSSSLPIRPAMLATITWCEFICIIWIAADMQRLGLSVRIWPSSREIVAALIVPAKCHLQLGLTRKGGRRLSATIRGTAPVSEYGIIQV